MSVERSLVSIVKMRHLNVGCITGSLLVLLYMMIWLYLEKSSKKRLSLSVRNVIFPDTVNRYICGYQRLKTDIETRIKSTLQCRNEKHIKLPV
ncbi:hypothetical protein AVEN_37117-1 [Araneus ventricosus]|uniref:Uncharacterized protein n=1 Tax=Araneus ventricosus TaxID=182803 RepID=A0A4Y2FSY9_ARAVE|nr:hypothetical protein AVEN_37117-1 [Araneus ventricosus]